MKVRLFFCLKECRKKSVSWATGHVNVFPVHTLQYLLANELVTRAAPGQAPSPLPVGAFTMAHTMINTITIKYQHHTTKTLKQILVNLIKLLRTERLG